MCLTPVKSIQSFLLLLGLCGAAFAVQAAPPPVSDHTARWNWFVDALYALHQERTAGREIKTSSIIGGYFREKEFYREVKYVDAATGRHLSTIQWEREHPERIHYIEVYVYDRKGRIARDYSALFLTFSRAAPQHTLINLHAYHGKLHAFSMKIEPKHRLPSYDLLSFNIFNASSN